MSCVLSVETGPLGTTTTRSPVRAAKVSSEEALPRTPCTSVRTGATA
ncbi:nuclear receptor subfamily 1, group H, member 4, isoform CRA_a [Mus musculus]|nr:nuclear receptor subfamily 1, group H, member 4, isoform CRA_a [Mus musculus]